MGEDFDLELDDLGVPDLPDIGEFDLGVPGDALYLPDPFAESPIAAETQGLLDSVADTVAQANDDFDTIAATEGLAPDLPAPGAESATATIDAAMSATPEQAHRMIGFDQGMTYEQDIKNDLADRELEVHQAEETSAALAKSELLEWQAERAAAAAESTVEESQRARGV
jgi:hypothetical protein